MSCSMFYIREVIVFRVFVQECSLSLSLSLSLFLSPYTYTQLVLLFCAFLFFLLFSRLLSLFLKLRY